MNRIGPGLVGPQLSCVCCSWSPTRTESPEVPPKVPVACWKFWEHRSVTMKQRHCWSEHGATWNSDVTRYHLLLLDFLPPQDGRGTESDTVPTILRELLAATERQQSSAEDRSSSEEVLGQRAVCNYPCKEAAIRRRINTKGEHNLPHCDHRALGVLWNVALPTVSGVWWSPDGPARLRPSVPHLLMHLVSPSDMWPASYLGSVSVSKALYGGITTSKSSGQQRSEGEVEGKKD